VTRNTSSQGTCCSQVLRTKGITKTVGDSKPMQVPLEEEKEADKEAVKIRPEGGMQVRALRQNAGHCAEC